MERQKNYYNRFFTAPFSVKQKNSPEGNPSGEKLFKTKYQNCFFLTVDMSAVYVQLIYPNRHNGRTGSHCYRRKSGTFQAY